TLLMKNGGMPAIAQGAMTGGLVYLIVALIVKFAGKGWIDKVLPPIVVGPIVMVIGLSLAPTAINDAMYTDVTNLKGYSLAYIIIAL
ncbi:solute carrier family 23 protein, partial [Klebsiella pneumoniae]|nr:solute carrier family 23 protein [Klebsiella pneumoniae]